MLKNVDDFVSSIGNGRGLFGVEYELKVTFITMNSRRKIHVFGLDSSPFAVLPY